MKPNGLDLATIQPSNGAKYSPNLHQFLASPANRTMARYARVYKDKSGQRWLGYLDNDLLIGARLTQVLCNGRKTKHFGYVGLGTLVEVPDFWRHYQADGRCAVDPEHKMYFIGDGTRWEGDEERRRCLWCGKAHQQRNRWTELVSRESWGLIPPANPATGAAHAG
jgi:hypothetical protein